MVQRHDSMSRRKLMLRYPTLLDMCSGENADDGESFNRPRAPALGRNSYYRDPELGRSFALSYG